MYFYIIDPQKLNQKTFERVQNQLYSCLSEYRINGEVSRVTSLRTIAQLVEIAFNRGVKTLVAVGTDDTLHEMINAIKNREVTIGYIPVVETELSRILGLGDVEAATKTIASRRIAQLDLGLVNNNWFFSRLTFGGLEDEGKGWLNFGLMKKTFNLPTFEVKFSVDGEYTASVKAIAGSIINARDNASTSTHIADPTDGVLDVILVPNLGKYTLWHHRQNLVNGSFENIPGHSLVHVKKIEILSPEGLPLKSGDKVIAKSPAVIEILPKALRMIVGRDRSF